MATVLQAQYNGLSGNFSASTTRYLDSQAQARGNQGTEANVATIYRQGGVLSNLYINVITNDRGTTTFRTRKATANANIVVTVTASTTGKFEDTTNTDTVTAGEDWHFSLAVGAGGTTFTIATVSILFAATTNTVIKYGTPTDGTGLSTASTTYPMGLAGIFSNTVATEANIQLNTLTSGTLEKMGTYIIANARGTNTLIRSRVNGANGNLLVTVTASTTGTFEDTSNSDSVTAGDDINTALTTGTGGGAIIYNNIYVDYTTTNGQFHFIDMSRGGGTISPATTYYSPIHGSVNTGTTEVNPQSESNLAFTASKLQCYVSANTIVGDSTLRFRKNTSDGNQVVTITSLTTGLFSDSSNSDTVIATDILNYSVLGGAAGTSLILHSISMLADSTVAGGTVNRSQMCLMGVQ